MGMVLLKTRYQWQRHEKDAKMSRCGIESSARAYSLPLPEVVWLEKITGIQD